MINLSMADPEHNLRPRLSVIGVGGAGGNAINNMIRCALEGCDFIAANTDSQALSLSLAQRKIQLGVNMSRGLGAGSKPDIGRAAAEEQVADILACLEGSTCCSSRRAWAAAPAQVRPPSSPARRANPAS